MTVLQQYEEQGYVAPVRVLTDQRARRYRKFLEDYEAMAGGVIDARTRQKPHLLFTWAAALIRETTILDAVEALIGPNILCWSTGFFIKEAHDPSHVTWHQDLTYWGLEPADVVTAWIALSPSTRESGCMRFVPGSHKLPVLAHHDTFAADNMLSRGQEIAVPVNEDTAVDIVLAPGEISLHHVKLFHASAPNRTGDRRIGLAIRYMPPHMRQVVGDQDSATLVRGTDPFGHFGQEPRPAADMEPAAVAYHQRALDQGARVRLRDTPSR